MMRKSRLRPSDAQEIAHRRSVDFLVRHFLAWSTEKLALQDVAPLWILPAPMGIKIADPPFAVNALGRDAIRFWLANGFYKRA